MSKAFSYLRKKALSLPETVTSAGAKKRPLELCRKTSDCRKGTKDKRARCFRHQNRRKVRHYSSSRLIRLFFNKSHI